SGCVSSDRTEVTGTVNPLPVISLSAIPDQCADGDLLDLTQFEGETTGGEWSGPGTNGNNEFDPQSLTTGQSYTLTYLFTDGNSCENTATATVFIMDPPAQPLSTLPQYFRCGFGEIEISVTSPDGKAASYRWYKKNGADYELLPGLSTATETVDIQENSVIIGVQSVSADGCGSSSITDIQISATDLPDFNLATTTLCKSDTEFDLRSLVDVQGGDFQGEAVLAGYRLVPSLLGEGVTSTDVTYSLKDNNTGCTTEKTVTINFYQVPNLIIDNLGEVCFNGGLVDLTQFEGGNPDGEWSGLGITPGTNQIDPRQANSGIHTLTYTYVTDEGCITSTTGDILVNFEPFAPVALGDDEDFSICGPGDVMLAVSSSNADSYQWFRVEGGNYIEILGEVNSQLTVNISQTTNYAVAAVSAAGCASSTLTEVMATVHPLPDFTFSGTSICANDENGIDLRGLVDVQDGKFDGNGVIGTTFKPTLVSQGTTEVDISYTVTNNNGCVTTKTVTIELYQLPNLTIEPLGEVCISDNIIDLTQFESAGFTGGEWSGDGVSNKQLETTEAGIGSHSLTYTYVTVNGCITSLSAGIEILDVAEKPDVEDITSCLGEQVTLTMQNYNSQYTYKWFDERGNEIGEGRSTQVSIVSEAKQYHVIAYNRIGCESENSSLTVSSYTPEGGINLPSSIVAGDIVQFRTDIEADSYFWDFGNGITSTEKDPFITYNSPTSDFEVSLTVESNGCVNVVKEEVSVNDTEKKFTVTLDPEDNISYADNTEGFDESAMKTSAYPNPISSSRNLTLSIPTTVDREAIIRVYTIFNERLKEERVSLSMGENEVGIDTEGFPTGFLIIMVEKLPVGAIQGTVDVIKVMN
ncbi:PKD domain-containing protein, partial [Xanthovirga aplysinae]|uniref:PKD domain-containing protein n=1 Tax=Xanthovirga aplysinae TaxID=2529853 RepID=UPI0016571AC3